MVRDQLTASKEAEEAAARKYRHLTRTRALPPEASTSSCEPFLYHTRALLFTKRARACFRYHYLLRPGGSLAVEERDERAETCLFVIVIKVALLSTRQN